MNSLQLWRSWRRLNSVRLSFPALWQVLMLDFQKALIMPPYDAIRVLGGGGRQGATFPDLAVWPSQSWHWVWKAGSHLDIPGRSQLSSKSYKPQLLPHSPALGYDTPTPMGKGASDASVQFQKAGDISHPQIIIMIFRNYYLCILHNCHNYYHQLISLPTQHALSHPQP